MFLKMIRAASMRRNIEFIVGLLIATAFIFIAGVLTLMYLLFS